MQDIASKEASDSKIGLRTAIGYSLQGPHQNRWREFAEDILQPLFDFLSERVGAESSILHTLERYRTRIEWFDRDELYARFAADRARVFRLDQAGSGSGVWCRASQGGGGRHGGAMATDDNAAVGVPPARAKPSVGEGCQAPRARHDPNERP
jgi:hypothetical protein